MKLKIKSRGNEPLKITRSVIREGKRSNMWWLQTDGGMQREGLNNKLQKQQTNQKCIHPTRNYVRIKKKKSNTWWRCGNLIIMLSSATAFRVRLPCIEIPVRAGVFRREKNSIMPRRLHKTPGRVIYALTYSCGEPTTRYYFFFFFKGSPSIIHTAGEETLQTA